jgi:ureidoglycolate lyase
MRTQTKQAIMDIADEPAEPSYPEHKHEIDVELITDQIFAPFGRVIYAPDSPGRLDSSDALVNLRPHAAPSLYTTLVSAATIPLEVKLLEQHRYSSQTFLPLGHVDYLIIVAHSKPDGFPDIPTAKALRVPGDWGITYAPGVWHHPMMSLGQKGRFAVLMWLDGGPDDEEFFSLDRHFFVRED